jgi:hypothetical protein
MSKPSLLVLAAGMGSRYGGWTQIEPDGNGAQDPSVAGPVTRLRGTELVSMNMWGFTPDIFAQLRAAVQPFLKQNGAELKSECFIPTIVGNLASSGQAKVRVLCTKDSWFGVTYREDRPRVAENLRNLIRSGEYPEKLWQ